MRLTIDLPDPVYRRMKAAVAAEGITIKEFVLRAIENELKQRSSARDKIKVSAKSVE
ncbi:MAG TPA: hypothetical protein VNX18_10080 [Bryobacteraceae bacterium]|jgi:hypothetical protein|nr:hypothetical protein [Bryobacteraceae bacterium]